MVNEKERKAVENIQKAYTEKKMTKLDELRALDQSIRRPANVFAYVFGGLGSLVLGGDELTYDRGGFGVRRGGFSRWASFGDCRSCGGIGELFPV